MTLRQPVATRGCARNSLSLAVARRHMVEPKATCGFVILLAVGIDFLALYRQYDFSLVFSESAFTWKTVFRRERPVTLSPLFVARRRGQFDERRFFGPTEPFQDGTICRLRLAIRIDQVRLVHVHEYAGKEAQEQKQQEEDE